MHLQKSVRKNTGFLKSANISMHSVNFSHYLFMQDYNIQII